MIKGPQLDRSWVSVLRTEAPEILNYLLLFNVDWGIFDGNVSLMVCLGIEWMILGY